MGIPDQRPQLLRLYSGHYPAWPFQNLVNVPTFRKINMSVRKSVEGEATYLSIAATRSRKLGTFHVSI